MKVVIIGGVAGGATAAARLRRLDESAEIIMFERGEYISYANCGLPYYIGEVIKNKAALTVQTPQGFSRRFNVEVRTNQEVTAIDTFKQQVAVQNKSDGSVYWESYDKLLLAPGAKPLLPDLPGIDSDRVFTLRTIPDTYRIKDFVDRNKPKKALIVGGGYIGLETAENLVNLGVEVILVQRGEQIMNSLDYDMACEAENYLVSKGIKLLLKSEVKGFTDDGAHLAADLGDSSLSVDMAVLGVGVLPDTLFVQKSGIPCNERGAIIVNDYLETGVKNIYAVGDAVEKKNILTGQTELLPLAGPANRQGHIAADNIAGFKTAYPGVQGSAILKLFDMTIAVTGLNEVKARNAGLNYDKVFTISNSHAAYYPGAEPMMIKTLFCRDSGRILGAQIVGFSGADKRCDVLATAIKARMTASDLAALELCYAPPFSSAKDPVNMIGYVVENILQGRLKQFHWHEVADLPRDGSVLLLDVRTAKEYEKGHISGFKNIPLDELRDNLDKLERGKKIYVHCQSGLRSYIACQILSQNGFDCYNFSGSYRLYKMISDKQARLKK